MRLERVILPAKLKKIEKIAFGMRSRLEECIIPESVTEIQMGAFHATGLTLKNISGNFLYQKNPEAQSLYNFCKKGTCYQKWGGAF